MPSGKGKGKGKGLMPNVVHMCLMSDVFWFFSSGLVLSSLGICLVIVFCWSFDRSVLRLSCVVSSCLALCSLVLHYLLLSLSCVVLSCRVLSCPLLSFLVLSCRLFCLVVWLFSRVLSCLAFSRLELFLFTLKGKAVGKGGKGQRANSARSEAEGLSSSWICLAFHLLLVLSMSCLCLYRAWSCL